MVTATSDLIEFHRRRAHALRAAALHAAFGQMARALKRLVGAPGAGRPAIAP